MAAPNRSRLIVRRYNVRTPFFTRSCIVGYILAFLGRRADFSNEPSTPDAGKMYKNLSKYRHSDSERSEGEESRSGNKGLARSLVACVMYRTIRGWGSSE
jgi:hypothetical protein